MKELMLHVERIVRPVRAFQGRKLRMRRELLSHLNDAMAEELALGLDESAAMEKARKRLGDRETLTQSLQQSVPLVERILTARMRMPGALERWEARAGAKVWGWDRPMTFGHTLILAAGAMALPYMAWMMIVLTVPPAVYLREMANQAQEHSAVVIASNLLMTAAAITLIGVAGRFVVAVAAGCWRRVAGLATAIYAILMIVLILCVGGVARQHLTGMAVARAIVISVGLLLALGVVGRIVGVMRRPYDEWLGLEIAP